MIKHVVNWVYRTLADLDLMQADEAVKYLGHWFGLRYVPSAISHHMNKWP